MKIKYFLYEETLSPRDNSEGLQVPFAPFPQLYLPFIIESSILYIYEPVYKSLLYCGSSPTGSRTSTADHSLYQFCISKSMLPLDKTVGTDARHTSLDSVHRHSFERISPWLYRMLDRNHRCSPSEEIKKS